MFLSIIIPIYNCEEYLADCLRSCCEQSINQTDYEIICVNDGSTDQSLTIISEFQKKYDNIILTTQYNQGVSSARNAGLKIAKGNYIWFVDSDDFIKKDILLSLKKEIFERKSKRYKFGVYRDSDISYDDFGRSDYAPNIRENYCIFSSIMDRSIIKDNQIHFYEELSYYEDVLFLHDFSNACDDITDVLSGEAIYYYRNRSNSATDWSYSENAKSLLDSLIKVISISIKRINNSKYNQTNNFWFWHGMITELLYRRILQEPQKKRQKWLRLFQSTNPYYYEYITDKEEYSQVLLKRIKKETTKLKRDLAIYSSWLGFFIYPIAFNFRKAFKSNAYKRLRTILVKPYHIIKTKV